MRSLDSVAFGNEIVLRKIKLAAEHTMELYGFTNEYDLVADVSTVTHGLVLRLVTYMAAQEGKTCEVQLPATWWDHFKFDVIPATWRTRLHLTVNYRTVKVTGEMIYPDFRIPNQERTYVRFATPLVRWEEGEA